MRRNIALSLFACLSACSTMTPEQQAHISQVVSVACNVDGAVVPVAQLVVATMGPGGAAVASMDSLLVHPAVVAACQALNGTPASATPVGPPVTAPISTPASAPATPPVTPLVNPPGNPPIGQPIPVPSYGGTQPAN